MEQPLPPTLHLRAAEVVSIKEYDANDQGQPTWHILCRSQIWVVGFRTTDPPKMKQTIEVEGVRDPDPHKDVWSTVMGIAGIAPRMRDRYKYAELTGAMWVPSKVSNAELRRNAPAQVKTVPVLDLPKRPPGR